MTDGQTLYVTFVVFAGSCVNATLFANVARLTAQISERRNEHARKMDMLNVAMRKLRVAPALANRVAAYYEYHWTVHLDDLGGTVAAWAPGSVTTAARAPWRASR